MSLPVATNTFVFVNSSDPHLPQNRTVRLAIRKQAMSRAAAARRAKGDYSKANRRQHPTIEIRKQDSRTQIVAASGAKVDKTPTTAGSELHKLQARASSILSNARSGADVTNIVQGCSTCSILPAKMPTTGYEALRSALGFDVLDLSALTAYHNSRITAHELKIQPSRLLEVLRCRKCSFVAYLPSRLGKTQCLDDVTKCVVTRVRECLTAPGDPASETSLRLYARALCSLQSALNDPAQAKAPDVLCATQLLAFHELLAGLRPEAWECHIDGAAALIRFRGPESYTSPFEKALLLALIGPIFTETFLKNKPCFLEEPVWQNVLWSFVKETETLSDWSELAISLWITICPSARLAHDIQAVIFASENDPPPYDRRLLVNRALLLLQDLKVWRRRFEDVTATNAALLTHSVPDRSDFNKSYEVLGICLGSLTVVSRLVAALDPGNGYMYERDAQGFAVEIMAVEQRATQVNARAGLFMAFKMRMANSVIATRDEWQKAIQAVQADRSEGRRLIAKSVFERWCRIKGRNTESKMEESLELRRSR